MVTYQGLRKSSNIQIQTLLYTFWLDSILVTRNTSEKKKKENYTIQIKHRWINNLKTI